jgi:hypothetical protein
MPDASASVHARRLPLALWRRPKRKLEPQTWVREDAGLKGLQTSARLWTSACIAPAHESRKPLNMSFGSPSPNPNEIDALGREEHRRREQASKRNWMPDADGQSAAGVRRRRGLMERLRSIFGWGDSAAHPPEPDVSGEGAWEAERQRRREHEQDQSGGRDGTLPQTRHRP